VVLACGDGGSASSDAGDAAVDDVASEPVVETGPTCDGTKTGVNGNIEKTTGAENILVRTPTNYDPTVGSPLIVVYAGCCVTGAVMEPFTGFTPPATQRGYVVAYVDHITPNGAAATADAASAVAAVEKAFCIDTAHVFLTGHSDGGSLTELIAIANLVAPSAIAPSASGMLASQLGTTPCPKSSPISVFDMHSSGDTLFPISQGYGQPMAAWWAKCAGCDATTTTLANGCLTYPNCTAPAQVVYCQGTAAHGVWPGRQTQILDFFDQYR
jgi:polyhydroxybutyrate depolymerase